MMKNQKGFIQLPLLIIIIAIFGIGASIVSQQKKLSIPITNDISTANISEVFEKPEKNTEKKPEAEVKIEPESQPEIKSKPKQISKSTEEVAEITQSTTENQPTQIQKLEKQEKEQETAIQQHTQVIYYPIIKVIDGDTFSINIDGNIQTVRLIGIDTPETVHPSKPVECFGQEASNKAKQILTNQKVKVEQDPTQGEYDKYGRLLAYIFLEDGRFFNKLMIEEGYGFEYTYNTSYKYQKEFQIAENQARILKKGLWADGVCDVVEDSITQPQQSTAQEISPILPIKNECSYNAYNCSDFFTHAEAQATYEYCGGVNNDIHRLDRDKDGLACESLP